MIKTGCYVRVSTENQLENYSIDEQTERLKAYCKAKDMPIIKFYTDGGYSGGNLNRPALRQLISDIGSGLINTVVVYKLDRLSRSQKDTLTLIEDEFLSHNVDFISVCENFDTSTAFGRAAIGILSVFAQLEKDQITERFTMGRIGRAKEGYYHGGAIAPTGYDYVDGNLIVNEYEAMQVRELYERFAKGYSMYNCWLYMQSHYTTKYGSWKSEALVQKILSNDIYIGKVKFKGVSYEGKHTPIIPDELFYKVQRMLKERRSSSNSRSPFRSNTLLSGLIYCGNCGARYHGEHGNYACYSRTKGTKKYVIDPTCKNKKWKIEELDQIVINYVCSLQFDSKDLVSARPQKKIEFGGRIREIDRQINRLLDLYQVGSIPIEIISQKVDALTQEKDGLIAAETSSHTALQIDDMIKARDKFAYLIQNGTLEEKRSCLSVIIKKIVITNENVNILLNEL